MDREKVIKELENLRDICNAKSNMAIGKGKIALAGYANAADDAIVLLKEQEAKRIVRRQGKRENSDGSIDYFAEWYCPHCNMLIQRGFDNPSIKFCYKCGKPILWEGR